MFYSLACAGVVFFFLPYAVKVKSVQASLVDELRSRLDIAADVDHMTWQWLPSPRIVLYRVKLSDDHLDVSYPYGAVCLGLSGSVKFQPVVRLIMDKPEIIVKTLARTGPTEAPADFQIRPPFVSLKITQGHLILPDNGILGKFATQKVQTEIFDINADLALSPEGGALKSSGRFSFADKVLVHIGFTKNRFFTKAGQEGQWRIDVRGENVDLTGARTTVMALFGRHRIAQKVCDIVRGGRMKTGCYIFEGPSQAFKDLTAMRFLAQADNVDILVPKIGLPLERVIGPVVIEDGILRGDSLSARLGNTTGRNGSIRIDLLKRDRAFLIDVDVDSDIKELRGWLINNLVPHRKAVVNELGHITDARGRAVGNLHISNSIRRPVIKVDVSDSNGQIAYDRFHHAVELKKGVLTFSPKKIVWEGVQGQIGSQYIDDSRGAVTWDEGVRVDVDSLVARLDAASFLKEKPVQAALEKMVPPPVETATGRLNISRGEIHGTIDDYHIFSYDFIVSAEALMIDSPLLPDNIRASFSNTRVSSSRFVLPPSRVDMSGQQLMLKTDIQHEQWRDFSGSLTIQGVIGQSVARWLKKKDWIPPRFFPKMPCFTGPLVVSWDKQETCVQGRIIPGLGEEKSVTCRLDLIVSDQRIDLKELFISSMDETADMRFCFERESHPRLKWGFAGSLKKETLDILLENNQILTGSVSGDCEMEFNLDHTAAHRLTGDVNVSWAVLFLRNNRIVIDDAAVSGDGSRVKIKRANLKLNDEAIIMDGRVFFPDDADIKTELNVTSRKLSAANLQHLSRGVKQLISGAGSTSEKPVPVASSSSKRFSATGIVNMDIKAFLFNPEQDASTLPVKRFVGRDLSGTISLKPDSRVVASLVSGQVCDVNVSGKTGLPPEKTDLTFHTDPRQKPQVQDLLDCLGISDRKISGKYVLDGGISGFPGNWTDGHFNFKARKGRMKGLVVISKILTLINVTELFTMNVFKNFFTVGYPYKEMKLSGKIKDNILTLEETQILGEGLDIFLEGTVDLRTTALDMVAYVKPFKMVDSIVTLIPYVGKNLGDGEKSIAFIPFQIKGTLDNPDVFIVFEDKNREGRP